MSAIRPRFQMDLPYTPEEVLGRIRSGLAHPETGVRGLLVDHHVTLKIPAEEEHFWSPQLSLEVEGTEAGSRVRGLYGPKPSIWLMFVFFYSFLGFVSMIIAIIGFSQLNLGLSAGILWLLPIAGIIFLLMWLSARTGQRLGRDQTRILQEFLYRTMESDDVKRTIELDYTDRPS